MGACLLALLFACNDADKAGVDTGLTSAGLTDTSASGDGGDGGDGGGGADTDCETRTWYMDLDEDGWGDEHNSVESCENVDGATYAYGDCDDTDPSVNPDATEVCNEVDDDCNGDVDEGDAAPTTWYVDGDGDGHANADEPVEACTEPSGALTVDEADDCDDTDPSVNPDATEVCNEVDDDCDGDTDEDASDAETFYTDADGDGHANPDATVQACTAPSGTASAADADDCDDTDDTVYPGADEHCDDLDEDCDDAVDEDAVDPSTWYGDTDGDGYGTGTGTEACDAPTGTSSLDTDCDDGNGAVHPGASEACNDLDDDCDGLIDDDDSSLTGATSWYADADADGYGDAGTAITTCDQPSSTVADGTDCDDADADVNPGASEVCNELDDDCDGLVDDDDSSLTGATTWYTDADGDGYGDTSTATTSCIQPSGTVALDGDCEDADAGSSPGTEEICDDLDNDCDGDTDEDATDATTWYADLDGDGYGDESDSVDACEQPSDYVSNDEDCDDMDAGTYTGAVEVCDEVDNDCDGTSDGGDASDAVAWYTDADGDGYGVDGTEFLDCDPGGGFATEGGDCDDGEAGVHPHADEVCNSIDDDCDGLVDADDVGVTDAAQYYPDDDGDGWGDDTDVTVSCTVLTGMVTAGNDCDDSDADTNPAAYETCDDDDDDCDGTVDESAEDQTTWHVDADGDGYGNSNEQAWACDQPTGYVEDGLDCNDADASAHPGGTEVCNTVDDDCDAIVDEDATDAVTVYEDLDFDGVGSSVTDLACSESQGWSFTTGDCDDDDDANTPGGTEICDEQDNDCDDLIDDDDTVTDATVWYADADGDGYGHASSSLAQCTEPTGYLSDDSDCDDTSSSVYPDAEELCNGSDDDCDGDVDEDACIDVSNVDEGYFAYASGDLVIASDTTFDTDTGTIDGLRGKGDNEVDGIWYDLVYQADGTTVALLAVGSLELSATLTVEGSWPLVILVDGDAHISGDIDGVGHDGEDGLEATTGSYPAGGQGPGGGHGGDGTDSKASGNTDGEGLSPGLAASAGSTTGNGGGGGGACYGGGGGAADVDGTDGEMGTYGVGGSSSGSGGNGGDVIMGMALEPLVSGSGGGGATSTLDGIPAGNGGGGGGGGLGLQISAKGTLTLDGDIDVSGGEGGEAWGGGGGGGSGGAVLLEAKHLFVNGSLYAEGGAGGDGDQTVTASGNGGSEGSQSSPAGGAGLANGGGGGGAAGRIHLRYLDSYTLGGTLSPNESSGCANIEAM